MIEVIVLRYAYRLHQTCGSSRTVIVAACDRYLGDSHDPEGFVQLELSVSVWQRFSIEDAETASCLVTVFGDVEHKQTHQRVEVE